MNRNAGPRLLSASTVGDGWACYFVTLSRFRKDGGVLAKLSRAQGCELSDNSLSAADDARKDSHI
jgi:hypothetical protein